MRIKKVVHPEIVIDKRGDVDVREAYKVFMEGIGYVEGEGYYTKNPLWQALDPNLKEHFLFCWKFKQERPPVYYVPKDFAEAISRIDRDIPVDLLPKRFFGYFAFADGSVFDESDEVQGAYVYVGPPEETSIKLGLLETASTCLWISYCCKTTAPSDHFPGLPPLNIPAVGRLLVELKPEKIAEMLQNLKIEDYLMGTSRNLDPKSERNVVYRTLVNLVLYVHSVDADLLKTPTHSHLSNRERSQRAQSGKPINECMVPLTLISWNYKKPVLYQKDSTVVGTHPRFQRCGPGFMQVKLIWVKEHVRVFKKDTADGIHQDPNGAESLNKN
jgi:hypothetical protein